MCQSNIKSNERMEPTDNKDLELNNQDHVSSSRLPPSIPEQRSSPQDVSSSQEPSSTIPTISLTSSDSVISNYSDYSVDLGPHEGLSLEEGKNENGHNEPNRKPPNENVNNFTLLTSEDALQQPDDLKDNPHKNNNEFVHENPDLDSRDTNDDEIEILDDPDESNPAYDDQHDIWLPPDAENELDNVEHSVAALDDEDDECTNGETSEWAMPSSLNTAEEGVRLKEGKQKAIEEVMNGKFKNLVSELLKKVGVENCDSKEESWVDTVTLLAWQAASFVKPEAAEGKAMDPAGYVKIKCLATESRQDSRVIRGLVFKKHAAHKHMVTKFKNPRLLLVQGGLEPPASLERLSSLSSLIAEGKDNLADLEANIKACDPNVILVEKSASGNLLKMVVDLKVTLVLDMKLNRLERVARCTGSPIASSDKPFPQKLKQCESLYFDKVVEEHAIVGEGVKKPCKTLMFLEGCPTRLGCTILLKGSHNEELKKIKCVVQCAVVMAYHFLLETSFLVDQEAMFSTLASPNAADDVLEDRNSTSMSSEILITPTDDPISDVEVPVSSDSHEVVTSRDPSTICNEPHMTMLSTASSTIQDVLEKVSFVSPNTFEDMSTYIDFNGKGPRFQSTSTISASPSEEALENLDIEIKSSDTDDMPPHNVPQSLSNVSTTAGEVKGTVDGGEDGFRPKDEISNLLDSESILVLMSRRNASKGTICAQSHFSHIKFYRHFDVPLGKFLRDNLFKQTVSCKTCNEPPEAHFYYYAHHSKQLTIKVKRIADKTPLPGESEGKLWMWSRCGKCEPSVEKSTKRVLISTAARGLSFGKFLELSFSSDFSFNRLSSCGHSFQKDFLYFFGLGSMVAMFRYSLVATYAVSLPSQMLEFNSTINGDWLQKEIETVNVKGVLLFTEVANNLKKLESRVSGRKVVFNGAPNGFFDIFDMLAAERSEFEENIKNMGIKTENTHNSVHKILSLNRLRWVILLEACVWERRLKSLITSLNTMPRTTVTSDVAQGQKDSSDSGSAGEKSDGSQTDIHETLPEQTLLKGHVSDELVREQVETSLTHIEGSVATVAEGETLLEVKIEDVEGEEVSLEKYPSEATILEKNPENQTSEDVGTSVSSDLRSNGERIHNNDILPSDNLSEAQNIPIEGNVEKAAEQVSEKAILPSDNLSEGRNIPIEGNVENAAEQVSDRAILPPLPKSESREWVWNPFSEIREECMMDLQRGLRPKFGHLPKFVLLQSAGFLPSVSEMILEEGSRLHIPLKDSDYILSDFDGEVSSSVACGLALLKDHTFPSSNHHENASLKRAMSEPSPNWVETKFLDPDVLQSTTSMSSASHFPNFDGLINLDSLVSHERTHPEVTLGVEKYPGKGKYSVVIIYADKFRAFREQCCPSELDYIASLSRCKSWDAKGGKSKSLFLKTLDDRLIVKEIKRTEFDSFMTFAPGYFDYMKHSVKSGNQTCLAKILGIYQVTIRNPKTGRESKHDLMVMENLSFGRNLTRQYDLKGALHARFTEGDGTDDVLLDQNFVNDMNASPLYIGQRAKRLLQRAVWNDTTYLHSINVMDYSLLVGVDRKKRQLLCGIIDYLRQYTWDKQFETWVKQSLVPKNVTPTIISPEMYKKRFRKFMDTHFLTVPDDWCSQRSSNPCKLCGVQSVVYSQKMDKQDNANVLTAHE